MCCGKSVCVLRGDRIHCPGELIDKRGKVSRGLLAVRTLRLGRGHAC